MAISSNNVQVYTTLSKELVAEIDKDAKEIVLKEIVYCINN